MTKITIELTQEQLDKIKEAGLLDEPATEEWYEPRFREKYWVLTDTGICGVEATSTCPEELFKSSVKLRSNRGRVYRTKEEAEKADERRIALTDIEKWCVQNYPFRPNWSDMSQQKWRITYYHGGNKWEFVCAYTVDHVGLIPHLPSAEACEELIKAERHNLDKLI